MAPSTALSLALLGALAASAQQGVEEQARSILAKRCVSCHNGSARTGGLDLSTRDSALAGGSQGAALAPGKPGTSLLMRRVLAREMPPGKPLADEERRTLEGWIAAGAPWTGAIDTQSRRADLNWWSLQPLRAVEGSIDSLLAAKLKEKGLAFSQSAGRRTLIRRAAFDLTGLPPAPEEVEAFVNDPAPDAYEKLLDRLLASPAYGERWGRHWLDVVRFGESHGYEQNHLRDRAWPYRDYVIRSFNEDKPFDRFVLEQLAGDQIAPGRPEVEAATGYLVAGIHDTVKIQNIEGELIKRANDLDDMVATTGGAFLGLTVNCARCHDHKFDPILQADYYRLQAVFAGVEHGERELATGEERERRRRLEEPLSRELASVKERIAALEQEARPRLEQKRAEIEQSFRPPVDSRGVEERFPPAAVRYFRMTILAASRNSAPAIDELEIWMAEGLSRNVALASYGSTVEARSTRSTGTDAMAYDAGALNDGKFDRTWISGESGKGQVTVTLPRVETIGRVTWSRDRLGGFQGRFLSQVPTEYVMEGSVDGRSWTRLAGSDGRLPYDEKDREEALLLAVFTGEEKSRWADLKESRGRLEKELASLPKLPMAYAGRFVQPEEPVHLAKRGNAMDKGDVMAPGSLSTLERLLPGFELDAMAREGERRLALARWIVDPRNALTARVLANRVWHYHFGRGIVSTPSDFGFNGARPTHPELLDWLARRLQQHGWRLKPFHKEIMLSAAYRQSGELNPAAAKVDADDLLLWRFPPRRLEAEAIRDSVLAVSGALDRRMGGPGFRLYKYTVDNVATYLPREEFGPETFRRAVYHQAARSVRDDMLGTYDCPDSTLPEPKRVVTTTPLQALSLLNSEFLVEQARYFAERVEREAGAEPAAQVRRAYLLAFGRPPKDAESAAAAALIRGHGLAVFCRALLNANEFVYVM